jgi:hypothetical protein
VRASVCVRACVCAAINTQWHPPENSSRHSALCCNMHWVSLQHALQRVVLRCYRRRSRGPRVYRRRYSPVRKETRRIQGYSGYSAYAGEEVARAHGDRPRVARLPNGQRAVLRVCVRAGVCVSECVLARWCASVCVSECVQARARERLRASVCERACAFAFCACVKRKQASAHAQTHALTCEPIAQSTEYSASPLRERPALNSCGLNLRAPTAASAPAPAPAPPTGPGRAGPTLAFALGLCA